MARQAVAQRAKRWPCARAVLVIVFNLVILTRTINVSIFEKDVLS